MIYGKYPFPSDAKLLDLATPINHLNVAATAQLHPRNSTAASLVRGQNPNGRSMPDRTACLLQLKMASKAQKLIDGTAIKIRANRRRFSALQILNRR